MPFPSSFFEKLARDPSEKISQTLQKNIAHSRRSDYKLCSTLLNTTQNNRKWGDRHREHLTVDPIVLETMAMPHGA